MTTETTLSAAAKETVVAPPVVTPAAGETKPAVTEAAKLTPEQQKVADDKVAAEAAAKPFTDAAQLKLPEGMKLDEVLMKDFLPLAKEAGLTAAQAQKLVEFNAAAGKRAAEAKQASDATASKAAVEALKNDKDIGGAKWGETKALVGKALAAIGDKDLNAALNSMQLADGSMLGDSLVMAKFLVNIGRRVSEDSTKGTHSSGAAKTPGNDNATFLKSLYGEKPGHLVFP